MPQTFDAVVIGAGIVGAACARELHANGLSVAVCDGSSAAAAGATGAAMGHIAVMDDSEAQFALTKYSQRLWREIASALPPEAAYRTRGCLWVAANDEEMGEVRRKHGFYTGRGVAAEVLDARQLREAEPNLRTDLAGALLLPEDSICDPAAATRAFLASADVRYEAPVHRLNRGGLALTNGEAVAAKLTIVAAGVTTGAIVPEFATAIEPRKGHLAITAPVPEFVRRQTIELGYLHSAHSLREDSVAFNVQPRPTGEIVVGSSRQYGATDPAIESAVLSRLLERAFSFMPKLRSLPIARSWTGMRAATRDKLPLIGPVPDRPGVYLATGHEGLGISTSLATARLLAAEILGHASDIPREPYAPARCLMVHNR